VAIPHVDVCLIGAGPQALAVAITLRSVAPELQVRAFDPSGTWMQAWDHAFAAFDIFHLRSPGVHHPHPDASAWSRFREARRLAPVGQYDFPSTSAFAAFCAECVRDAQLADAVEAGTVCRIRRAGSRFTLECEGGRSLTAEHVVVATNPRRRRIPAVLAGGGETSDTIRHSSAVDLRTSEPAGRTIGVIGGGLTAYNLAAGAVARGARVLLITRRALRGRQFDVDPGWLGPKYLAGFSHIADPRRRRTTALAARDGGSMTPAAIGHLRSLAQQGLISVFEGHALIGVDDRGRRHVLRLERAGTPCSVVVDEVWFATGSDPTVHAEPFLRRLARDADAPVVEGLPVLDHALRWPGAGVHVAGALAMLELGPAAGNLWGGRRAGARIAHAIVGNTRRAVEDPAFGPSISMVPPPGCGVRDG